MSIVIIPEKITHTHNLRQWIAKAGKVGVTRITVIKKLDGGADVKTTFDDGYVFIDTWASFSVFEDYMLRRSRNFRNVPYTVFPELPKGE